MITSHLSTSYSSRMDTKKLLACALAIVSISFEAHAAPTLLGDSSLSADGAWLITITDLGLLPGGLYASAYAINDTDKIVGMAYDASGALQTVQWVNGQISVIPGLSPSAASVPDDINDAGEISGRQHVFSGGIYYGIYWDALNNPLALEGLPSGFPYMVRAHAINASGQIAGMAQQGKPDFWGHAAVWHQNSLQTDLGFMGGGHFSEAYGINDAGDVVGVAAVASTNQHAFLWQNGQYTDLSTWSGGGASSIAYGINNLGVIVGLNSSVASVFSEGKVTKLTMPAGVSAFTPAIDINDAGDIIATGSKGFPIEVGVLWRNGKPIDLGTLPGGTISRARRINGAGEIVGEANAANGFFHAVKWSVTPVAWTNLGQGLAGSNGVPQLTGQGSLVSGSTIQWSLTGAKALATTWLVVGTSQVQIPLLGGTLVPAPSVLIPLVTSAAGTAAFSANLANGLPTGQAIAAQAWLLDPAGIQGWAASNAILQVAP